MSIPEEILVEIDVEAALECARRLRREKLDREIIAALESDAHADAREYDTWEGALGDGLDLATRRRAW